MSTALLASIILSLPNIWQSLSNFIFLTVLLAPLPMIPLSSALLTL
jgi:hypothetical protein